MSVPIIGGLIEIGAKLIDKLVPNPEAKARLNLELLKLEREGELEELKTRMSAIVAEAQSSDPWTSRARPTFMYVFYFVILALVILANMVGVVAPGQMEAFFTNVGRGFQAIPEELWWTFTAGYLGYSGVRTFEKVKGAAK